MKRSLILLLPLGACVSPPKPAAPPVVQSRPAPVPVPPPAVAWEDRARTSGNWIYTADGASFVGSTGGTLLNLRCVAAGEVAMTYGAASSGQMTIRTTTLSRSLRLAPDGQVRVAASDQLLDALIYSRGRFMVSAVGQPDLIIPPWPEIARVVEDCRR